MLKYGANPNTKDKNGNSLLLKLLKSRKHYGNLNDDLIEDLKKNYGAEVELGNIKPINSIQIETGFIAKGSSANVYSGSWNNTKVAIKQFSFTNNILLQLKSFYNEIDILNKLIHSDNVIHFMSYDSKHYRIIMEYADSGSLYHYITHNIPLPWSDRYEIFQGVVNGLAYVHEHNIIHRDIKTDNILLQKNLTHWQPKIIDFGISAFTNQKIVNFMGSPYYMSPEALNEQKQTQKSDMFSLAMCTCEIVLWKEMQSSLPDVNTIDDLVEYHKFERRPRLTTDSPPKFAALLFWPWKNDPDQRPTAAEMQVETQSDMNTMSEKLMKMR